jgi:hypothetical protein
MVQGNSNNVRKLLLTGIGNTRSVEHLCSLNGKFTVMLHVLCNVGALASFSDPTMCLL